jgi:hypothetical protein
MFVPWLEICICFAEPQIRLTLVSQLLGPAEDSRENTLVKRAEVEIHLRKLECQGKHLLGQRIDF